MSKNNVFCYISGNSKDQLDRDSGKVADNISFFLGTFIR